MWQRILESSFFSLAARGLSSLVNLVLLYAVGRRLGRVALGTYSIAFFVYHAFAFLSSLELTTYFARETAAHREDPAARRRLAEESAVVWRSGVLLGFVALLGFLALYRGGDARLLGAAAATGLVYGLEKNLSGMLLGLEKMPLECAAQLLSFALTALPALMWIEHIGLVGLFLLRGAVSLATVAVRLRGLPERFPRKTPWWGFPRGERRYFALAGLALLIHYHLDLLILSFLIARDVQGEYFLASRIYLAFSMVAETCSFALVPFLARARHGRDGLVFSRFLRRLLGVVTAAGAAMALALFLGRGLLVDFFSPGGTRAPGYLAWFSVMLGFRVLSFFCGDALTAGGRQPLRFWLLLCSSILLLLLQVILGRIAAVEGILWAKAVVEATLCGAYGVALARKFAWRVCP